MTITNGYCDLSQARKALRLQETNAAPDPVLERVIEAASRDIDAHCERRFYADVNASARKFVADGTDVLEVDDFHSTVGLIIKLDRDRDGAFEVTLTEGDYELHPLNGVRGGIEGWPYNEIVLYDAWWPCWRGRALVEVTAKWGWAAVPKAVTEACIAQMVNVYKSPEAPFGVASFDQFGPMRARPLHPTAAHLLRSFDLSPVTVA